MYKHKLFIFSFALILLVGFIGQNLIYVPSVAAQVLDSDGDGVPDSSDNCPGTPSGTKVNSSGCPIDDTDADGVPNTSDDCPNKPGSKANNGCPDNGGNRPGSNEPPPPDTDGDGTADPLDRCPYERGDGANYGCPEGTDPNSQPDATPEVVEPNVTLVAISEDDECSIGASARTNRRKLPSISSEIVGTLTAGQVVPVISQWFNIKEQRMWLLISPTSFVAADAVVLGGDCRDVILVTFDPDQFDGIEILTSAGGDDKPDDGNNTSDDGNNTSDDGNDTSNDGNDTSGGANDRPTEEVAFYYNKIIFVFSTDPEQTFMFGARTSDPNPIIWDFNGTIYPSDPLPPSEHSPYVVGFIPDDGRPGYWGIYPFYDPVEPREPLFEISAVIPDGFPGPGVILDTTVQSPDLSACLFTGMGLPPSPSRSWLIMDPDYVAPFYDPNDLTTTFLGFTYVDVLEPAQLQLVGADANMDNDFGQVQMQISDGSQLALYDIYHDIDTSLPHNNVFDISPNQTNHYRIFYSVLAFDVPLEVTFTCN